MIVFVTCLRHPESANNYAKVEDLLESTLKSVVAQTSQDFHVVVVGHVRPSFTLPAKVQFVEVDLPPPTVEADLEASREVFRHDKGQKIAIAVRYALEYNPSHIVAFDADDFVSRGLAAFLNEHGQGSGWYIEKGYMYSPRARKLALLGGFHRRCGTSLIYNVKDLKIPDCPPDDHAQVISRTGAEYFKKIYGSHVQASEYFAKFASSWQAIPFPAAVYTVETGENHSSNQLPQTGKFLPLSDELKAEFGLSEPAQTMPLLPAAGAAAPPILQPSDGAILETVQKMLAEGRAAEATVIANELMASDTEAWLGRVAAASIALRRKNHAEAYRLLSTAPDDRSRMLRPNLYVTAAFRCSVDAGLSAYGQVSALGLAAQPAQAWPVVRTLALNHRFEEAEQLLSAIDLGQQPPAVATEAAWIRRFLRERDRSVVDGDHAVRLGVIDYKSLDMNRSSTNIGDPIQTLAYLGNLARFSKVKYQSDDGIGGFVTGLQDRVPDRLRDPRHETTVRLVRVNRDASTYEAYPQGTWVFVYGWYMHHLFHARFDLPLNTALRPIFISFHVNEPRILTPAAIRQLRQYGPIGCRDWSTVNLLRQKNVPAFFTGCITTTMGTILRKEPGAPATRQVALVEANPEPGEIAPELGLKFHHGHPDSREASLVTNLETAVAKLETYCGLERVITSRLHCYLPSLAMGVPVDFKPRNPKDIRFAGLAGLNIENLGTIRDPILSLMNTMLGEILAGKSEEEVYAAWRAATEPLTHLTQP
ncbi:polysaccharide pyruvyl transferase family protein [Sediminicoccus rosea]|uniref:Polysaccharide pyruvyl transferase domain-containing protein n=1 Tax=Sediminicoccus rosea TaxID=1225128 RepID=A0ABZ0PGH9_9PROT|nr:polysaccharide pyruvyl transferase family protein [Sediminicoccus rosea]WPB84740.1 hypothetical protein R9Z33_21935 [Sediminicoccus rosea]